MPEIEGLHHVALPARDAVRSSGWYESVFGFFQLLVEEEEDRISSVTLGHPSGVLLVLHQMDGVGGYPERFAGLAFKVPDRAGLDAWERWLTDHQVAHSGVRPAHLGWALDVIGPDGVRIQLHTRERLSSDDH